ncbi:MAG TPA: LuxR C-terminal-related transcriptional regulator [Ferruginibacter sp.]|nr:LuxR C-terminal-related transcriptional regulator [Ferruginibacter sp.]HRO06542.1 LuxR C-terminal-related transcriptional regulator [Ferruginibacter sp.]HRO96712.1 LuxR C-terminal-related transcriptional regulator [Ferruginibacter sp.]HRP50148.1 LuxR C-terminal-related transcriptional regulator [Ferruginibacter sp.]
MKYRDELNSKLETLIKVENDFPGAVIIHDIQDSTVVYMNPWGLRYLGTSIEQLQTQGTDYHSIYFNQDDHQDYAPKIFNLLQSRNDDEHTTYFQQVRRALCEPWVWFLSCTKIYLRNEKGEPTHFITTSIPVDASHFLTNKIQRLLDENLFLSAQLPLFAKLSKREQEILKLIALGKSNKEIASDLFIAEDTVKTHRKKLKVKLCVDNQYDMVRYAQSFNLI